jgi:hypothetical protein
VLLEQNNPVTKTLKNNTRLAIANPVHSCIIYLSIVTDYKGAGLFRTNPNKSSLFFKYTLKFKGKSKEKHIFFGYRPKKARQCICLACIKIPSPRQV